MVFPKFHGIQLALGASIQNAVVENLSADPTPLTSGRIWYNTTAKALKFSSLDSGGAVIVSVVATGADVAAVVSDLAALGARVDAVEADYVKKDGSVAFTGNVDLGSNKLTNVANGSDSNDAVNFSQLQAAIGSLANAFEYIGTLAGGTDAPGALDLTSLETAQHPGAYYKVSAAGYFKVGPAGTPFFANLNDGLVFNTTAGVDIVDNTNSTVVGTGGEIAVTGSADTGFTVGLDATFKGRVSTVESGLTAEVSRATGAEGTLQDNIDAEATRAQSAEGVLTDGLSDEVTRATDAEGVLTTNLTSEVTRATTAEGTLTTNLAAEVSRATGAEDDLSAKIGDLSTLTTTDKDDLVGAINELASGGSAADAKIGDLTTLTTDDKSTVVAAINEVDAHADAAQSTADGAASAAAAEATRAQGVEGSLASLTTTAKGTLVAAINEVDANADAAASAAAGAQSTADTAASGLAAEITRATGVEGSLAALTTDVKTSLVLAINEVDAHADANATAIASEVSRATGAEGTLTSNLAAEVTRATGVEGSLGDLTTTDKSTLVAAINEVADAAGEGTGALKDAINAQRYVFTAATAALSHVISHNLNSAYVSVQVWVKGDDDLFRNDIVAVEETNSNSITISLTESRIVKVAIQALDQLA